MLPGRLWSCRGFSALSTTFLGLNSERRSRSGAGLPLILVVSFLENGRKRGSLGMKLMFWPMQL